MESIFQLVQSCRDAYSHWHVFGKEFWPKPNNTTAIHAWDTKRTLLSFSLGGKDGISLSSIIQIDAS